TSPSQAGRGPIRGTVDEPANLSWDISRGDRSRGARGSRLAVARGFNDGADDEQSGRRRVTALSRSWPGTSPSDDNISVSAEIFRPGPGFHLRLQPRRGRTLVQTSVADRSQDGDGVLGDRAGARAKLQHAGRRRAQPRGPGSNRACPGDKD